MRAPSTIQAFTEAAADAVGREIARLRREADRERELREAEHRARLAELEVRLLSAADLERRVAERLNELRDGEPGAPGEPGPPGVVDLEEVRAIVSEQVGALPPAEPGPPGEPGEPGQDVDPEAVERLVEEKVARAVEALPPAEPGPPGEPGRDVDPEDVERLVAERVEAAVQALPKAKDGEPGRDGADVEDIEVTQRDATVEFAFTVGEVRSFFEVELPAGPPGDPGREGPQGKMALAKAWSDQVHYEGDIVTLDGSTYQALRDTGRPPPADDWAMLAARGADGQEAKPFSILGTWNAESEYGRLDVVALNGASFVAKRDAPGPCPGEGWQLMAAQGKRGSPGEPGRPGEPGKPGPPGKSVLAMSVDDQGLLTLVNGDGTEVTCDLYPLLSKVVG